MVRMPGMATHYSPWDTPLPTSRVFILARAETIVPDRVARASKIEASLARSESPFQNRRPGKAGTGASRGLIVPRLHAPGALELCEIGESVLEEAGQLHINSGGWISVGKKVL